MKKLQLAKETLRQLSPGALGPVQAAMPALTYTCDLCLLDSRRCPSGPSVAHTQCVTPTITRSITYEP
jgi:hypothetical protein